MNSRLLVRFNSKLPISMTATFSCFSHSPDTSTSAANSPKILENSKSAH